MRAEADRFLYKDEVLHGRGRLVALDRARNVPCTPPCYGRGHLQTKGRAAPRECVPGQRKIVLEGRVQFARCGTQEHRINRRAWQSAQRESRTPHAEADCDPCESRGYRAAYTSAGNSTPSHSRARAARTVAGAGYPAACVLPPTPARRCRSGILPSEPPSAAGRSPMHHVLIYRAAQVAGQAPRRGNRAVQDGNGDIPDAPPFSGGEERV